MSQNTLISKNESNAIVAVRATAMFSIILCHILQAYNNYIDLLFNVGVQVFLVMSGYLYGKKNIKDYRSWYRKRFIKLYIPYIIVTAVVIILHLIFSTQTIKWYQVVAYLTNTQGLKLILKAPYVNISGLDHLWFMTAIMFAYFSTPILQKLKRYHHHCIIMLLAIVSPLYFFIPPRWLFGLEWFWLYAFGYFFANLSIKYKKVYICLFSLCYLIVVSNIRELTDLSLWKRLARCHHSTLGILLFTLSVTFIRNLSNTSKTMNILRWFDRYSYFIYLTHFVVMIGSFSLAHITESYIINISLMILTTAILTYLLVKATKLVSEMIE